MSSNPCHQRISNQKHEKKESRDEKEVCFEERRLLI
jgi:hypothetical protein